MPLIVLLGRTAQAVVKGLPGKPKGTFSGRCKIRLIVTSKDFYTERRTIFELKKLIPGLLVRPTGFRSIFALEAEGDLHELASRIMQDCSRFIGHVSE